MRRITELFLFREL